MEKIVTTISIDKPDINELSHVGVKGMHWGRKKSGQSIPKSKSNNKPKLTPEQKHARVKKVLMVSGAVTVTAALAYGGYKMHNARIDKVISATKSMPIKSIHMDMPFSSTPLGKKVAQNAVPNMQRQSTKDLAKEMKSFTSSQAALRDQLRNLNR